jgi:CopG family nickel-responsive transcriptional regulator
MADLIRFGISIEKELSDKFDRFIKEKNYTNRSEAIRDLIRDTFVKEAWRQNKNVSGAITMVYDHHQRELVDKIIDMQHDFSRFIISSQHVHLNHHDCLEVVVVKGVSKEIQKLADRLKSIKGVKNVNLAIAAAS